MNPKLKKIIAREGIIVLLTILAGCIILITVRYIGRNYLFFLSKIRYNANVRSRCWIEPQYLTRDFSYKLELLGIVLIFCYPTYLLTKFIIWAIKVLRENKVCGKSAVMSQKVGKEDKKRMAKKILVVDDEPSLLYSLELFLESRGYEVVTAGDGIEALNKVKANNCDMIITNINMPGIDGIQLLREIAKLGKNLIKIVYSGLYDPSIIEEAEKLGCFAYIRKPADLDGLENTIRNGFLKVKKPGLCLSMALPRPEKK